MSREIGLDGGRWVRSRPFTEADTNGTRTAIAIPAKTLVTRVLCVVTEAFAGGTPALDVGEAGDADGWVDVADITETTVGVYSGTAGNGAGLAATGKYYPTGGAITITLSADLTDGTAYVLAHLVDLDDVV